MSARILYVDDEAAIRRLLRTVLERGGHSVIEAADARAALDEARRWKPDMVLLDLGLPDRDGLELVPQLALNAAVVVLTARDATADKVTALDLGAVDYVVKPFDSEELLARVRVALRNRARSTAGRDIVQAGSLQIDLASREILLSGQMLHLPPREFSVLLELARHPGRVLTHRHLLTTVWGEQHADDVAYLRVAVRALRAKLEPDPARPSLILNEPGIGYRLMVVD